MKILVFVKHAVDESELMADAAGRPRLQSTALKMSIFDRRAVEEALRIRESTGEGSVCVLTMGDADAKRTVREAMAMGADRGCHILSRPEEYDALSTAYVLSNSVKALGGFDLILCSEGSSDTYSGLMGPMVAEWSALPYLGYVRRIEVLDGGRLRCAESLEDRIDIVEVDLPAVVEVVSEINDPRNPTLIQIMRASKQPIEEISAERLRGPDAPSRSVSVVDVTAQQVKRRQVVIQGSPEEAAQSLLELLRGEGVLP